MLNVFVISDRTIGILGALVGVIGLVTGWVFYTLHKKQLNKLMRERTRADWEDIKRGITDIRRQLIKSDFIPDVLVCPLGTSLLVTELLALSLEDKKPYIPIYVLETIDSKLESENLVSFIGEGMHQFTISSTAYKYLVPLHFSKLRKQKALVFDDGTLTGTTLACIKDNLRKDPFGINARTAVLFADNTARLLDDQHDDHPPHDDRRLDYIHRWVPIEDFHMPWGHILEDKRHDEKGITRAFVKAELGATRSKSSSGASL